VVGAGISGLAAAWFYRRAAGPSARILVLDNHDDFGGHAKRNEFTIDGRLVLGYGGSESIDSPRTHYSDVAKALLRELGVEIDRFESAFDRKFYASRGLARGVFFPREAFGRDALVPGEPASGGADELARALLAPGRLTSSSRRFQSRRRARRNCARSMTARAIRSRAGPPTRNATSSSPPATATI